MSGVSCTAKTVTWTFQGNGATSGSSFTRSATFSGPGTTVGFTYPANPFTKTGYTFIGWKGSWTGATVCQPSTYEGGFSGSSTSYAVLAQWSDAKTSVTIPSLSDTSKTYSGSAQSPTVNNLNTTYVTQSGDTSKTDVGNYTITWSLKDTSTSQWSDGTTANKTGSWSIAKASQTISSTKTSCTLTLGGTTSTTTTISGYKTSVSATSSNTGVATVSVSGGTVTITRVADGSATISVTAPGNSNYNASNTVTIAVTCNTQTYSVTYNKGEATSGSAPAAQTKTYGKSLTLRTNTGGLAFNDTKDTTYTVTYNSLGGTAKSSSDAVRWKVWSVVGWANSQGGTKVYDLGATYTGNAALNLYPSWTAVYKTDEVTLPTGVTWADGSAAGFAITYDKKGGSGGPSNATSSTRTIKYTFKGWSSTEAKARAGSADVGTTKYTPTANTTLYAAYTSTTAKSTYTIPTTEPTKKGYTFKGWAITDGGGVKYAAGTTLSDVTAAVNLYAVWQANSVTVTFDKNGFGGTITGTNPVVGDHDSTKAAPTWAAEGYTFNGWSTSKTSLVNKVEGGANFVLNEDVTTYYVNATIITYQVTVNFGEGISKVTVENTTSGTSTEVTATGTKITVNHGDSLSLTFTGQTGYDVPATQTISNIKAAKSTTTYIGTPKHLKVMVTYTDGNVSKSEVYIADTQCGSTITLPGANDKANTVETTNTNFEFVFDVNDAAASGGNTQVKSVKTIDVYKVSKWKLGTTEYSPGDKTVKIPFTDDPSVTFTATYNSTPTTTTYEMVPKDAKVTCPHVSHSGGKFLEGWYDTSTTITGVTKYVAGAGATFTPAVANYPIQSAAGKITFYAHWVDKAPAGIYTLVADPDGSNRR